jgi:hypothetical protein
VDGGTDGFNTQVSWDNRPKNVLKRASALTPLSPNVPAERIRRARFRFAFTKELAD